jgi:predicted ribosome quality control (RQC) complex YloA/Tae2 family protein
MLQNYFFLNRFLLEVKSILVDSKIEEIFSQEKSKLVIVTSKNKDIFYLEFCVIPGNSYLNHRKNYSRAKKNTVNFFDDLIGEKITSFEIANNDRVVKINCTNSRIFFAIRGKFTNVFYIDKFEKPHAFKSLNDRELLNIKMELSEKTFLDGWNSLVIQQDNSEGLIADIRKKYPFLGSEIAKEVKARINEYDRDTVINTFYEVLNEVKNSKPCVFKNEAEQEVHIGFENFKSFPITEKKIFENIAEAVNFVLSKRHYLTYKYSKLKLIKNHLEREMKKVSAKINNLQGVIEIGSKEEDYNKFGNLLLSNLGSIKSRMNSIVVEDFILGGGKIKIDLYPALSPQKNVDYYFDKSRSEKISFAKNQQLFEKAKKDFDQLRQLNNSLNEIDSSKELDELMKKLKIKQPEESEAKEDLGSKFKQYIIDSKYKLYVGKDSKNNDLLTTRFAKQNDYWFHARGASGSHVIIKVENTKEPIPKNVLKKAAALAAYHSKAKTAGVVPVAFTFKKYVVKKKGDPVGTVHLLREDVLLVRPEIPNGCEFVTSD